MKILITGSKGFLGSALWDFLSDKHKLTGLVRQKENSDKNVYEISQLSSIDEHPDVVIMCHAAVASGNDTKDMNHLIESNVLTTQQMVQHFSNSFLIYISSISVYGNNQNILTEQTSPTPETEYAISKLWGEKCVSQAKNYAIVRLTSLYGKGMKENTIIPNYINQALLTGEIEVWGQGERRQNYIHVEDLVRYIENLISTQEKGIFVASNETEVSNIELAKLVAEETGAMINFKETDNSISIQVDNKMTRNTLSIKNTKDFREGIKEYIQWKKKQF